MYYYLNYWLLVRWCVLLTDADHFFVFISLYIHPTLHKLPQYTCLYFTFTELLKHSTGAALGKVTWSSSISTSMIPAALLFSLSANHQSHVVWLLVLILTSLQLKSLDFYSPDCFLFSPPQSSIHSLHGRKQALPLWAYRPRAGVGGTGSLFGGCGGTSSVCHFLYNGGADGEHWDNLEHVPVLPTGKEKNKLHVLVIDPVYLLMYCISYYMSAFLCSTTLDKVGLQSKCSVEIIFYFLFTWLNTVYVIVLQALALHDQCISINMVQSKPNSDPYCNY